MDIEKKIKGPLQNKEAMMEKKARAIEKINALMENKEKKFNPRFNFPLTNVLSEVSPQYYTKEELAQIEKINQSWVQEKKLPLNSQSTREDEKVNNKKRLLGSNDKASLCTGQ